MKIQDSILREELSYRGGGVELDLTDYGYPDELLSAYQNYLGGGMRGNVGNSCTVEDWQKDEKLLRLAEDLREYFLQRMYEYELIDEFNEGLERRPVSYPGL